MYTSNRFSKVALSVSDNLSGSPSIHEKINGEIVNYASADDGLHALKVGLAAKNSLQNNCVEMVN